MPACVRSSAPPGMLEHRGGRLLPQAAARPMHRGSSVAAEQHRRASQERLNSCPRPLVIAGPSGVGKGTIIKRIRERFPTQLGFSVSHTTRKPRPGEADGVDYHFTTLEDMDQHVEAGHFVEHAMVHGNHYGTSYEAVLKVAAAGRVCILDIDSQGVRNVKGTDLGPYFVFISPPSIEQLEGRLRGRQTEKEEDILKRLANARAEMEYGVAPGNFDGVIVNDDLERAVEELCARMQEWYPHLLLRGFSAP